MFKKDSPCYHVWQGMRARCLQPTSKDYDYYGGRGITICPEWDDFFVFEEQMGERPEGYTLERKDNDGPYCKDNCVWVSRADQNANRRSVIMITHDGLTLSIADWARKLGIGYQVLYGRYRRNKNNTEAIFA